MAGRRGGDGDDREEEVEEDEEVEMEEDEVDEYEHDEGDDEGEVEEEDGGDDEDELNENDDRKVWVKEEVRDGSSDDEEGGDDPSAPSTSRRKRKGPPDDGLVKIRVEVTGEINQKAYNVNKTHVMGEFLGKRYGFLDGPPPDVPRVTLDELGEFCRENDIYMPIKNYRGAPIDYVALWYRVAEFGGYHQVRASRRAASGRW